MRLMILSALSCATTDTPPPERNLTMTAPKFPHVEVQLSGEDGNAFFIICRTRQAMRKAGVLKADIEAYVREAMSGDYDHVLQTTMATVSTN